MIKKLIYLIAILFLIVPNAMTFMGPAVGGGGMPPVAGGGTPESLAGSYTTTANVDTSIDIGRPGLFDYSKQSFVLTGSGDVTVTTIYLWVQQNGTCDTNNTRLQVYTGTASTPDTQVENADVSVDPQTFPSSYDWVAFTFGTPITLTLGTMYVLVVTGDAYIDSGNKAIWGADGSASPYDAGEARYGTSLTSSDQVGGDFLFDVWGY